VREAGRPATGIAALLAVAFLWGSNHVVARGASDIVPFAAFIFVRWAASVPVLAFLARRSLARDLPRLRPHLGELAFLGVVGVGLFSLCLIGGAYTSLAIEVSIINTTTPAWVAVIAVATGRATVTPAVWGGLAVASLGALVVVTRGDVAVLADIGASFGNLLALAGAILFAWYTVRLRPFQGRFDTLTLTTVTAAAGTLLVLAPVYLASLLMGGPALVQPGAELAQSLGILAYATVAPTLVGNTLYIFGMSRVGPQKAASFLYLMPVASAGLAILLLGETLAWHHVAGFVLVVGGLVTINRSPADRQARRRAP